MLTRAILLPMIGTILSSQFEDWFYMGRMLYADTSRISADNAHFRV
jgi:hypothetical protein